MVGITFLLFLPGRAHGWHDWDNGGPGHYWNTPGNWQDDVLPGSDDNPRIDMDGSMGAIINSSMTSLPVYATVAIGCEGSGRVSISGGILHSANLIMGGDIGSSAICELFAGVVAVDNDFTLADNGTAFFDMTGGSLSGNNVYIGSGVGSEGTFKVNYDAVVTFSNSAVLGVSGSGILEISNGQMVIGQSLILAQNSGSVGRVELRGGTLRAANLIWGDGEGTIDISGGTLILDGQISELPDTVIAYGGNEQWYLALDYDSVEDVTRISVAMVPPIFVWEDIFDYNQGDSLGLMPAYQTETVTVFQPVADEDMKFNNHPQLAVFQGRLYITWTGHPQDELSDESWVFYSISSDGISWSEPQILGPDIRASSGWHSDNVQLVNYMARLLNTQAYVSLDGKNWTDYGFILNNAAPSESDRALPEGRLIMPCHGYGSGLFEDVKVTRIMYTDTPNGLSGWQEAILPQLPEINISDNKKVARAVEPSWFIRPNGELVMVFRDLNFNAALRNWKLLASVSSDRGQNWTLPVLTNMPDSDSMQCAGNLPDGWSYLVNNPIATRRRVPLAITISRDGKTFDSSYLLRGTPPAIVFEGGDKTLGYSYPGSVIWGDYLYIAYATNKENIDVTRVPWRSLVSQYTIIENFDGYPTRAELTEYWQGQGNADLQISKFPEPGHAFNSLNLGYENNLAPYYSSACKIFAEPQNLSSDGIHALDISLKGDAANPPAVIYVELSDGDNVAQLVLRNEYGAIDYDAVRADDWFTWHIDLQNFSRVNLEHVVTLAVGCGYAGYSGGGNLYIDDVRLYPGRCFGGYPDNDLNGDCIVDMEDFMLFVANWAKTGFFP